MSNGVHQFKTYLNQIRNAMDHGDEWGAFTGIINLLTEREELLRDVSDPIYAELCTEFGWLIAAHNYAANSTFTIEIG